MIRYIPVIDDIPLSELHLALPNPHCISSKDFLPDDNRPSGSRGLPPYMPVYMSEPWHDLLDRFCEETGYDPKTDPDDIERSAAFDAFMREL